MTDPVSRPARLGILLFAHGARDPKWAEPFDAVAARVRGLQPGCEVALGFLEFMAPDLAGAGDDLAARGCTEVRIVPLFLGAGGHVRRDVPPQVEQLRLRHPAVRWALAASVGESPGVIEAMARSALAPGAAPAGADNPGPAAPGSATAPHR